jgi:hypothetical protein
LGQLCADAGLVVERSTGAYTFLLPPAVVLGWFERLRSGRGTGSPQSDVDRSPSGLGGVLGGLASIERRVLGRTDLPGGLSVIAIARRPD